MLFIVLFISLLALSTIVALRRFLHPIEIVSYWAFVASVEQMFFTIVTLNLGDVQYEGRPSAFWSLKQGAVIINPVLVLWCLAWTGAARSMQLRLFSFMLCDGLLVLFNVTLEKNKLLVFEHWSLSYSALLYAIILILSAAFMTCFRMLMRREGIRP